MLPVEKLFAEHRIISQCLELIPTANRMMENAVPLPSDFFGQLIAFSREFIHRYHHFKEEYHLFPLVARKAKGPFRLHLAFLRNQHEQGQQCIDEIEMDLGAHSPGHTNGRRALQQHLAAFHALLSEHIRKEDEFFPLIGDTLTQEDLISLEAEFALVDDITGPEFLTRNRERVRYLSILLSSARQHLAPPKELLLPAEQRQGARR